MLPPIVSLALLVVTVGSPPVPAATAGDSLFIFAGDYDYSWSHEIYWKEGVFIEGEDSSSVIIHSDFINGDMSPSLPFEMRSVHCDTVEFAMGYCGSAITLTGNRLGSVRFVSGGGADTVSITGNHLWRVELSCGSGYTFHIEDNIIDHGIWDKSGDNWTTISGNTILNGRIVDKSGGPPGVESQFIENNTIHYQATGDISEDIAVKAVSQSVTIRNNVINCTGRCCGIELPAGAPAKIIDNEITLDIDDTVAPLYETSYGISATAGDGEITDNKIHGAYIGYLSASNTTLFANNEITEAHTGFYSAGMEEVRDNVITHCRGDGMIFQGVRGPVHGNIVTDNDSAGIKVILPVDMGGGADGCVGGNIIRNNGYCDLVVLWDPTEEETLFVRNNVWDHDNADDILANDICNDGGSAQVIIDFSDFIVEPDAPALLSPADGVTDAGLSPQLSWHPSEGAEHYWLQASADSAFAARAADTSGITDTTFTLSGLSPDTEYFWRVAAGNLAGYGDWSQTWSFIGQITVGLSVAPDSLGFGEVPVGGDTSLVLRVRSTGTSDLQVSDINVSDPVFTVSDTAFSLAPAESADVTVTFTPTAAQSYSGTLTLLHNAAKGTTVIPVAGAGAQSRPMVLSMELSDPSPTGPGPVDFTFAFDRAMDVLVEPAVSYGLSGPYEDRAIVANPGWAADSLSWTGTDTIAAGSAAAGKGDGLNTVKVQGAQDPDGRMMDPDTGRTFFVDTMAPFSMASSPEYASALSFTVRWSGGDPIPASGIASYSVNASEDGAVAEEWIADTTATSAVYEGTEGHSYRFYSVATDSAGNRQTTPVTPQCSTFFDLFAPQITATTVWTDTSFGGPFAVSAQIEDSVGVGLALLWYRTMAETLWQADTMTAGKDLYAGAIPVQTAPNTVVMYYVHAEDVAEPANVRTDPPGGPAGCYSFTATVTGVEEFHPGARPGEFVLHQNVPNPFNAGTSIHYVLPEAGEVRLEVYNILGQRVNVLADGRQDAGAHVVRWDGRDDQGRQLSSGIYLCRLSSEDGISMRKMVLVR